MYLYTLKQRFEMLICSLFVVNRFKKNVSLHVETTEDIFYAVDGRCESL